MEVYLARRGRGESCKLLRRAQRQPALSLWKVLVGGWATSVQVATLGQYRIGEPASSWPSAGSGRRGDAGKDVGVDDPVPTPVFWELNLVAGGNSWGPD